MTDETLPPKTAYYARFLRAGGSFSFAEWRGILDVEDRSAAEAAGEVVAVERARAIAAEILAIRDLQDQGPPPAVDPLVAAGHAALREVGG